MTKSPSSENCWGASSPSCSRTNSTPGRGPRHWRVMSFPSLNTVLGQADSEGLGGLSATNQDNQPVFEEAALNPLRATYFKTINSRLFMRSPGPYQSPRSPRSHCDSKPQREQSPNNKHSYRSQNLHLSPLASRSQPCTHLASVAPKALEYPPSAGQMLSLEFPLGIERLYFLQGLQWDLAGLRGWVWGANLEKINCWSEREGHIPVCHPWSLFNKEERLLLASPWALWKLFPWSILHSILSSLCSHAHSRAPSPHLWLWVPECC